MTTTMTRTAFNALRSTALFVFALVAGSTAVHAQTAWDGGGGDSDYSNNLNWAGNTIPGNSNNNGALIGGSSTQTVVYSTSTSYSSTGTGKANSLLVGTGAGGVGSLTLSGSAGTLTFGGDSYLNAAWIGTTSSGANATGTVTVSAGTLAITGGADASINIGVDTAGAPPSAGTKNGTLIINGGTVNVASRILMGANNNGLVTGNSTGTLTISSGLLHMQRTGTVDPGLIRLGVGTSTVNLDGGTAILSGFYMQNASSSTRSTINFNGTTLRANVANADYLAANGSTANVTLSLKDGGLIMDTNGFDITFADGVTKEAGHAGLLRKEGNGTLTLSAANDYDGGTTVNGGTLLMNNAGALGSTSGQLTVNGGIMNVNGHNLMVGNLTGVGGTIQGASGTPTLTIGQGDTGGGNFQGIIANGAATSVALTKTGTGTITLSGNNTYTGATSVNAGTLVVNGSFAAGSVVSVGVNGTLGGTGTINGATTIFGAHTPGNSPGIQTFASNLAYEGGNSTVQWELVGNTTANQPNPDAVYDQIIVGGDLDFTDTTELDLVFNGTGSTVLWSNGFWGSNQTWTLYDVAGSTTGFLAGFSLNPSAWLDSGSNSLASVRSGASFNVSQSGSDILINYVAVPEPATIAILAGGVIGLAVVLRRRLRR
jgi:autotransporter-associated beta strand protein